MRTAPSVRYPVGRSVFWGGLLGVLSALGLVAVVLGARYGGVESGATVGAVWILWLVGAVLAWRRQPQGSLHWQPPAGVAVPDPGLPGAGGWSWSSAAYREGVSLLRVERVYDFQITVLLRLHNPDGATSWAWVERRADPARWSDLRRALWAHA
jgi:hypothetical protein